MSNFSVDFSDRASPGGHAVCVLRLRGELDAHTAPEFEAALQSSLDRGLFRIVADGGDLGYVSSAGLGVFMAFLEPTREAGGDLKIAGLPDRVFETFDLLGFPSLFDFEPAVDAALARFDAPPEPGLH